MKQSIFFDLDGTLWDAISPLIDSYNESMIKHGYNYKFDYSKVKSCMGLTPLETGHLFFPELNEEEGLNLFRSMVKEEIAYLASHPGILYDDEEIVLKQLSAKYDLYIVSNADVGYIENYLNSYPELKKYFKGHLCAGDTSLAKWQNIQYLKNKENIDDVIYVGDTLKDKVESTKAGVKFIHAAYGFGVIEDDEHKIDQLNQLPNLVDELFNK